MTQLIPAALAAASERGRLVLVVGPSGAGKDTLMDAARAELDADPRFHFARRLVTRPALPGAEDHDSCDERAFTEALERGAFLLSWRAHGLSYAIPHAQGAAVVQGRTVVANVSRGVLGTAERLGLPVAVVEITAPVAVLARRLATRGRETETEIARRLAREAPLVTGAPVHRIVNDRSVGEGAANLAILLRELAAST